ncbi:50S ribosomal protein L11 methyltransferase [Stigmatella aurantiaca]|nr:50S ribosomal protein L11 methyltransferase [Stigmatella aurantiaca]
MTLTNRQTDAAAASLDETDQKLIPRWHFAMLNDVERNDAFSQAVRRAVVPGMCVLDVGSGSGLLSMMATQAGANTVISCESVEPVAAVAQRIIESNGFHERITIVPKVSFDLIVGRDLPRRADILITETVDCGLVGEGLFRIIRHARDHLLHEQSQIIPRRASIFCALLESSAIHKNNFASDASGFDVSLFNRFSTQGYFPVRLWTWEHRFLSEKVPALSYDFLVDPLLEREVRFPVRVKITGTLHGILFWFELDLGSGIRLSNEPGNSQSHWMQAIQCFEKPCHVKEGSILTVKVHQGETNIDFEIE